MRVSGRTLLITGASGFVGGLLAQRFFLEPVAIRILLHRHIPTWAARAQARVEFVQGDLTKPLMGLSGTSYRALASSVTEILHCAARTDFTAAKAEADRTNVGGTKSLITFAGRCDKLVKFGVLSTAYVAGRRRGVILEDELDHRDGFVNAYEASKYRMEQALRASRIPAAIYRMSTIVGSARPPGVQQFNALHHALRLYYQGWVPMVPGDAAAPVDLISAEYAADAVVHLFQTRFEAGRTYHIVAGDHGSPLLGEFLESTASIFARLDPQWRSRGVAVPPIVTFDTFRLLEDSVKRTGNSFLAQILRTMGSFAPQLCYAKQFDATNTKAGLRGSGIRVRPLHEYYPGILRHCLATRWGVRPRR